MISYYSYKDTGIEWLDEIPNAWDIKKIKFLSSKVGDGLHGTPEYTEHTEFYFINGNNLGDGLIQITPQTKSISEEQYYLNDKKLTLQTLLLSINGTIGNVAFYRGETVMLGKSAAYIKFYDNINIQYIRWYLESSVFKNYYELELSGTTIKNLSLESIKNTPLTFPEKEEQIFISRFLDQKTSQIDRLIEQKEKLLKLLAEKRTAIITQAVTKGLDPRVKMKDSGIDLLGNIPLNWKVSKIKFNGQTRYGLGEPPPKKTDGMPFIRATDIFRGKIDMANIQFIDPDFIPWSKKPTLHEGEILVVRSGAYTGDSAMVTKECDGFIAGYDMVYSPKSINSRFISYVLLSEYMLIGQIYQARSRAAQPHLNAEELGNFTIAMPPIEEQNQIAEFLNKFLDSTDTATTTIIKSISKLKEYREALITSAVTGQIDVRKEMVDSTK
ncbi:MAG: restriction endonuclease subunit S [Mariniphaga sp.]